MRQTLQCEDAFKLMKYQNPATGRIEWVWNSRDGFAPAVIPEPGMGPGDEQKPAIWMHHVDHFEDAFMPNFVPPVGMRVFFEITEGLNKGQPTLVVVTEDLHDNINALTRDCPLRPQGVVEGEDASLNGWAYDLDDEDEDEEETEDFEDTIGETLGSA